jgi:hypothetical protein
MKMAVVAKSGGALWALPLGMATPTPGKPFCPKSEQFCTDGSIPGVVFFGRVAAFDRIKGCGKKMGEPLWDASRDLFAGTVRAILPLPQ